ncbi:MAG: YggT family protein [Proteobacteria bacterium]|nr:YggT family protein [Pseudomonadota bacterium]
MPYLINAETFLVQTIFDILVGVFLVRAMLIAVNASFHDPICQFVYKFTNPVIAPLRRFLPRRGKLELASLLVAFLLALIELLLLLAPVAGLRWSVAGCLLGALAGMLNIALWVALWALLIRAVLSFFADERAHPNVRVLVQVTEPLVRPFRRLLPPLGGVDLSFLLASIALVLARLLVIAPLTDLAARV